MPRPLWISGPRAYHRARNEPKTARNEYPKIHRFPSTFNCFPFFFFEGGRQVGPAQGLPGELLGDPAAPGPGGLQQQVTGAHIRRGVR